MQSPEGAGVLMPRRISEFVALELLAARRAEASGDGVQAFRHLERAHVLGQSSTRRHVAVHARMLMWAWRRRDFREALGQIVRIVGAATKTAIGPIPAGNTGGANVSPFKPMPIAPDLARIIADASQK